jgi:hypothetical protein
MPCQRPQAQIKHRHQHHHDDCGDEREFDRGDAATIARDGRRETLEEGTPRGAVEYHY